MPDATLVAVATFLVPILAELFTRHGVEKEAAKADKRLVASIACALTMAVYFLAGDNPAPDFEELVAQFALLRASVEGGHAVEDGLLKKAGIDLSSQLAPDFGIGKR